MDIYSAQAMKEILVFKLAKSVFLSISLLFSLNGCGTLYSLTEESASSKAARAAGKDPFHIYSCGPMALESALNRLGVRVTHFEISKSIQQEGSLLRDFMSVFHTEARSMTFPAEIKYQLQKHGFIFTELKSLTGLSKGDTAIVLLHKRGEIGTYHWACFPTDKNLITFFGTKTVVDSIYLVKK